MAYVSVDKNGSEEIWESKPKRSFNKIHWYYGGKFVELPKGSIKKLIGRELTWEDEPVELK